MVLLYQIIFRKNLILTSFYIFVPIIVFIFLLVSTNKDPLYLAKERFDKSYTERFTKHTQVDEKSYAYFYRSPYANKDLIGYSFRIFDNLTSSINLHSLENSLKYFVKISTGPRSTANSSLKPTVPISGFVNIAVGIQL